MSYFPGGKLRKTWFGVAIVVAFKNLSTLGTISRHKDFVTVVLVNCFEKIVMATNNSGLNSTFLLISE